MTETNSEPATPKYLGVKTTYFEGFDTFPAPVGIASVEMASDEFTAVCPVTSQPDQYTVIIKYVPIEHCLESKSLKLYLQSFRNTGCYCEALAAQIACEVGEALAAASCDVTLVQKPRGGISISANAYWFPAHEYQNSAELDRAMQVIAQAGGFDFETPHLERYVAGVMQRARVDDQAPRLIKAQEVTGDDC